MEQLRVVLLERLDALIAGCHAVDCARVDLAPDTLDRIQHQQVTAGLALRAEVAQAGEPALDGVVRLVPGRLMQNAGRVVALGFAAHGVPGEMMAAQIDPEECLPGADGLVRFEVHLPARTAVKL